MTALAVSMIIGPHIGKYKRDGWPKAFYPHFRMVELYMRVGLFAQAEEEITRAMDLSTYHCERRLVRELRALDRKRASRRIWHPDFTHILSKRTGP